MEHLFLKDLYFLNNDINQNLHWRQYIINAFLMELFYGKSEILKFFYMM